MFCTSLSKMTSSPAEGLLVVLFVTVPVMVSADKAVARQKTNPSASPIGRVLREMLFMRLSFLKSGLFKSRRQAVHFYQFQTGCRLPLVPGRRAWPDNPLPDIFPRYAQNSNRADF